MGKKAKGKGGQKVAPTTEYDREMRSAMMSAEWACGLHVMNRYSGLLDEEREYGPVDQDIVKEIAAIWKRTVESTIEIGRRLIDGYQRAGEAGEEISMASYLRRLARHPDLACSDETLRRCVSLYEITTGVGLDPKTVAPTLKLSAWYELAKLHQIENPLIRSEVIKCMAEEAESAKATVSELASAVSDVLRDLDIHGRFDHKEEAVPVSKSDRKWRIALKHSSSVRKTLDGLFKHDADMTRSEARTIMTNLGDSYVSMAERILAAKTASGDAAAIRKDLSAAVARLQAVLDGKPRPSDKGVTHDS